jgi:hypothetical protein
VAKTTAEVRRSWKALSSGILKIWDFFEYAAIWCINISGPSQLHVYNKDVAILSAKAAPCLIYRDRNHGG